MAVSICETSPCKASDFRGYGPMNQQALANGQVNNICPIVSSSPHTAHAGSPLAIFLKSIWLSGRVFLVHFHKKTLSLGWIVPFFQIARDSSFCIGSEFCSMSVMESYAFLTEKDPFVEGLKMRVSSRSVAKGGSTKESILMQPVRPNNSWTVICLSAWFCGM